MSLILKKGSDFIWKNARLLERAVFDHRFHAGNPQRVLKILRTYQNKDGGFGHALEPDLRAPDSQPLFVEFALRTLYECSLRDADMALRVCDFLSRHADLEQGIPALFPSSQSYPRAPHWHNPAAEEPARERLIGLVGLLHWQGVQHPWLAEAADACVKCLAEMRLRDAHTILNAFCLLESLPQEGRTRQLFDKLSADLQEADFFCLEAGSGQYGLSPLVFAPAPAAYCRRLFADKQIEAHLDCLTAQQEEDGGWPLQWEPPGEMARLEWRAYRTVVNLATLRAYGRI